MTSSTKYAPSSARGEFATHTKPRYAVRTGQKAIRSSVFMAGIVLARASPRTRLPVGSRSNCPGGLAAPAPVRPGLAPVAADLHRAPAPGRVLRPVVERLLAAV